MTVSLTISEELSERFSGEHSAQKGEKKKFSNLLLKSAQPAVQKRKDRSVKSDADQKAGGTWQSFADQWK
jgi:hypothetical protein